MKTWMQRAAFAVIGLAVSACGSEPADDTATLHRGNRIEPLTLDPHVAVISGERTIIADMFAGLFEPAADASPIPGLAQSYTVSTDGLIWTFDLREASWSDGAPITAGDVVYGLQRALDPMTRNQYPAPLFLIENAQAIAEGRASVDTLGVRAVDERTVVIRVNYPAPYLPSVLMYWGQPVPRHVVDVHGDSWVRAENMVVSGPFQLAEWRSNDFIHLTANPEFYAADAICLTDIFYYPTIDTASAERRVRNGELDLNIEFSGANLEFLQARNPEILEMGPGVVVRDVTFNNALAPFDDVRVRRALSMAIDRRFIANAVLAGADTATFRLVPDGVTGQGAGVGLDFADQPMDQRRAEAGRLLAEAGFGPDNPLEVTLYYQPSAGWPRIAPVIQQDWALIAPWVRAEVAVRDSQLHYDAMRVGDFQVASSGWVGDFDDPYAYLLQYEGRASEINYSRWNDPEFDRLVAQALNTPDVEARATLLAQAEQLFLDASGFAPIFVESRKHLVGSRVTGWITNPFGVNQSRWMCVTEPAP